MVTIPINKLNVDPAGNISPKFYEQFEKNGQLLVHSIFHTIQGEGPYAGRVATFVRLGGCNLGAKDACTWCDTAFSVGDSKPMTVKEVIDEIERVAGGPIDPNHLTVVTGGEPLLQSPMLEHLAIAILDERGGDLQIETNGLYLKSDPFDLARHCIVSPKVGALSNKYPPVAQEVSDKILGYKFVVSADPESPYHTIPEWAVEAGNTFATVYISPMCVYKRSPVNGEVSNAWDDTMVDREATARNYAYAAKYVVENQHRWPMRLSIQSHLFLTMP